MRCGMNTALFFSLLHCERNCGVTACWQQFKAVQVVNVVDGLSQTLSPTYIADDCYSSKLFFVCSDIYPKLKSWSFVCASSVKACTNSWSVWELSPSSGGRGCIPHLGLNNHCWVALWARTHRQCCAASSALPWFSRSLQWHSKTDVQQY